MSIWILIILPLLLSSCAGEISLIAVNPCCYYPCHNSGVCVRFGTDRYECDCSNTGFYGENCTNPQFWTWVHLLVKPNPNLAYYVLTHFHWLWNLVNNSFLRDTLMRLVLIVWVLHPDDAGDFGIAKHRLLKSRSRVETLQNTALTLHLFGKTWTPTQQTYVFVRSTLIPSPPTYNSKYGYLSWETYYNISYYSRLLPPVPEDCPTPMGTKGKHILPDSKLLVNRFLLRQKFRPDPQGSNLMFGFFAQHFTHQFFKTNFEMGPGFTRALGHGVDASNIYGDNLERQLQLRLHKDGKLKYQVLKGEVYPPTISEVPVIMHYPQTVPTDQHLAVGHESFGMLPGLIMYATLWLREHNRVCDILKEDHPTWEDEQLFQTARLILIGETIHIVVEEYVQQLSGYLLQLRFDPSLIFNDKFQYSNRISLEFNHLYHWHALMPDSFLIDGNDIPYSQFMFNSTILMEFGLEKLVDAFSRQHAGQIGGGRNINHNVLKVAEMVIRHSRELRVQPFNEYRKKFSLTPYTSFYEFTDDEEIAKELEELYGDIDALEFYPGLLLEKTRSGAIFGQSMVEMGAPFSLKGLMGNPICSPDYWKPSTFGGQRGFDIVTSATLKRLVCFNTKWCPYVAFHVPRDAQETRPRVPPTEL